MNNQQIGNNGTAFAFRSIEWNQQGAKTKKGLKSLLMWLSALNFKHYYQILIRKVSYFCTPKNIIVENNLNISDKLQMADILVANAELSAFTINMDDNTTKFINETKQRQDEVLKLKEVNEERLRMVVQF